MKFEKTIIVFFILIFLTGCTTKSPAENVQMPENIPAENELIDKTEFKNFLIVAVNSNFVNEEGAAPRNQEKYLEISAQRISARMIMKGIAENNKEIIEKGIKAIEYGFEKQNEDGSFDYADEVIEMGAIEADFFEAGAFFMQSVGQSYFLIKESEYSAEFLPRFELLKTKMRKTMDWLYFGKEILFKKAENAPNRLMFDGLAFKLNGKILEEKKYETLGDEFVNSTLEKQREDGSFIEHNGYDSSYQGVTNLKLQQYLIYSKNKELNEQIWAGVLKGIVWEKTKIKNSGEISSNGNSRTGNCQEMFAEKCKEINYSDVAMSFVYYGLISNDSESLKIAEKITEYATQNS